MSLSEKQTMKIQPHMHNVRISINMHWIQFRKDHLLQQIVCAQEGGVEWISRWSCFCIASCYAVHLSWWGVGFYMSGCSILLKKAKSSHARKLDCNIKTDCWVRHNLNKISKIFVMDRCQQYLLNFILSSQSVETFFPRGGLLWRQGEAVCLRVCMKVEVTSLLTSFAPGGVTYCSGGCRHPSWWMAIQAVSLGSYLLGKS